MMFCRQAAVGRRFNIQQQSFNRRCDDGLDVVVLRSCRISRNVIVEVSDNMSDVSHVGVVAGVPPHAFGTGVTVSERPIYEYGLGTFFFFLTPSGNRNDMSV